MDLAACRYLVIEGPIGAGKTSLARELATRLSAEELFKQPDDNPFLARFYDDMPRFALATQLTFLFQRVDQLRGLAQLDMFRRPTVGDFLLDTALAPRALLDRLHGIERRQRRKRGKRNAARTLDLDLLLFGRRRLHVPRLTLPHPRMHARAFVLRPLIDVAPAITIPGHGLARQRLRDVKDQRIARTRTDHHR
jgi:hypothetical protein